jgi:hypothetical protein
MLQGIWRWGWENMYLKEEGCDWIQLAEVELGCCGYLIVSTATSVSYQGVPQKAGSFMKTISSAAA